MTIDPSYLDFGDVWETEQFEWTVPVYNHTDKPLQVVAYGSSCSCVSSSSRNVVPPGSTAPIAFHVDLRAARCASAEPQAVSEARIRVALGRDDARGEKMIAVELRGRVKRAIDLSSQQIDFGRFAATATPKQRVVAVRSLLGLSQLEATVEGAPITAELKLITQDRWELHVQPVAPLIVGRHEAKVRLAPTTALGESIPPIVIPVVYDVLHDIQPDTSLVPLGVGHVGETLIGRVTISSRSGRSFVLSESVGDNVTVKAGEAGAPKTSYTLTIERTVSIAGNQMGTVNISGRDADGHPYKLCVNVQWYGVSP